MLRTITESNIRMFRKRILTFRIHFWNYLKTNTLRSNTLKFSSRKRILWKLKKRIKKKPMSLTHHILLHKTSSFTKPFLWRNKVKCHFFSNSTVSPLRLGPSAPFLLWYSDESHRFSREYLVLHFNFLIVQDFDKMLMK